MSSITRDTTSVPSSGCEDFLYDLKASARAAACGGRPRPAVPQPGTS